jgi:uncharacterized protein (DUF433 family)
MKLDRITINADICFGKPCIRGMRIPVYLIVDMIASGKTIQQILTDYPYLEEEDIKQAITYAAALTREEVVNI